MLDINSLQVINIKTYQRKKQVKTYRNRMNKISNSTVSNLGSLTGSAGSSVLVQQDCLVGDTSLRHSDEANESCELPKTLGETGTVYHTSLLVDGDILLGRACPVVELESREQENKLRNLEDIFDERSVEGVSVLAPPGKNLQCGNRDEVNVIHNGMQDVSSVKEIQDKSMSFYEDKPSYDASVSDTSVEKLESGSLEINPNLMDAISSSPQLGGMTDDVGLAVINNDCPQKMLPSPLEGSSVSNFRKKLLVLDVNGLLVDIVSYASEGYNPDKIISGKAVFKRPFCDDFLQFCFDRFHVGVWSSRTRKNLDSVLEFLMGKFKCRLLFCWDQSHCTDTGFNTIHNKQKPLVLKELKKLWEKEDPDLPWDRGEYNKSNTLLLDDSPYKALRNPSYTAIFPHPFRYKAVKDNSLGSGGTLRLYLEGLTLANNVQEYVELNPFGQRPITKTNPSWNFYLKVMNTSSSQPEEDNNSLVCQQRLTPNDRDMVFDGQIPFNEPCDQHMGFEDRCTVVKTRKRPLATTPLPSDASDTIYVEGLPLDSTRREVAHIFRPFEGYKNVRLLRKESRHRGGYPFILGFVEFVDPDCAAAAFSALDGYKVDACDPYSSCLRLQFSKSDSVSRGKRQCRYYDR